MGIEHGDWLSEVRRLKKERNAVVLVHNYQRPELYAAAHFIGDSLDLSRKAAETDADVIVFCGVKFMAETAKILNPEKTVLLPEPGAGCSLADMITADDVRRLKEKYPDAAVVGYVNTHAEVKALCNVCCTSANAVRIVKALSNMRVTLRPDSNLGQYVQEHSSKELIVWEGYCAVHHLLDADSLAEYKAEHPGCRVIAHPECREELLHLADKVCGTGGMAA